MDITVDTSEATTGRTPHPDSNAQVECLTSTLWLVQEYTVVSHFVLISLVLLRHPGLGRVLPEGRGAGIQCPPVLLSRSGEGMRTNQQTLTARVNSYIPALGPWKLTKKGMFAIRYAR